MFLPTYSTVHRLYQHKVNELVKGQHQDGFVKNFLFEARKIHIISRTKVRRDDLNFVGTKKMKSFYESIKVDKLLKFHL